MGRERFLQSLLMHRGLGEAQAALAPHNTGQFFDQMILCGAARRVLGRQSCGQGLIIIRILPGEDRVTRQNAMAQGVETGGIGPGPVVDQGWHGLSHFQMLLARLGVSIRASNRCAWIAKA